MLGLDERKRERIEALFRSKPDKAAAPQIDVGCKRVEVARADTAVETVGGDDEIGIEFARRRDIVGNLGLELELDAERLATFLQDVEQALPADAAKAVAARGDRGAAKMDVDVVPVVEGAGDFLRGFRVGRFEVAHRVVREHDAPAERVVGPVALDDTDRVLRIGLL